MDRFRPGQSLASITAPFLNQLAQLVGEEPPARYAPPLGVARHGGVVWIKNSTGETRNRFDVVAFRGPVLDPRRDFQGLPVLGGHTPDFPTDHGNIAVLQVPLAANAIGPAVISGVTIARWQSTPGDSEYGEYADFHDGAYHLRSRPFGGAIPIGSAVEDEDAEAEYRVVQLGQFHTPHFYVSSSPASYGAGIDASNVQVQNSVGTVVAIFGTLRASIMPSGSGTIPAGTSIKVETRRWRAEGELYAAVGCFE